MYAAAQPDAPAAIGFPGYLAALGGLPVQEARPLSLRLQVPDFGAGAGAALATYLAYLKREAAIHGVLLTGLSTVRQLAFDGPAPPGLAERQLAGLLDHLRGHFRFMPDAAGDYEALVDMEGGAAARLACLRMQGFNRVRVDTGAGDPGALGPLVEAARAAGFRSAGIGLAYGMPGQDLHALRRVLDAVARAAPDRVLLVHRPDTGCDATDIPAGGVAQRMQQLCADRLDMAGYAMTGAGRYARLSLAGSPTRAPDRFPGTHLVGCGVGASGQVGRFHWRNATSVPDYYARLDRFEVPVTHAQGGGHAGQTRPYLMQVKEFQEADQ